jgi:hypothetical protein
MKLKLASLVIVLVFGFLATSVLAENGRPSPRPSFSPRPSGLTQARLRTCEAKQESVQKRLESLTNLAVMMEGKFEAIAKRVQDYYNDKLVPSGKTLPNYQALVDDIAAKKALVDTSLGEATNDSTGFSCAGDDPKGLLNQYRLNMQLAKKALQNYRTSIKNLIVAVRTLGGAGSPEPSASPEPTATP